MKILKSGFFLTLILSLIVLEVFYGKLLNHCNTVYFADGGDTLQVYYTSLYHLTQDKSYFHIAGMNYPYGENIFFTGGHMPIIILLKLTNNIVDLSGYAVGIINLVMLLSMTICALYIYLIFREFSLPQIYSSFAAVGIAFLSPQMQRLGTTLSYEFFVPMYMYLLVKFYKKPSFKKSIIIGIIALLAVATHAYLFLFFCFLALFYWAILFFSEGNNFSKIGFVVKHFSVQMIAPYAFFNILLYFTDSVNDRTQYPWGFFEYLSSWSAVFFPFGKPYQDVVGHFFTPPAPPSWEGITYIGAFAVCSFIALIIMFLVKVLRRDFKQIAAVTNQKMLNIFFWASLAALLYSFGYPFIWNKNFFIQHIGPLRQLRALGRFSWLFFYVMNIVAFYNLYYWLGNRNKVLKYSLIGISFLVIFTDAYYYVRGWEDCLDKTIKELADTQNNLPEDKWLKDLNTRQYQAIIPLPYFHVGSEDIDFREEDMLKYTFIVSLKSGLPTTAVRLGRTSLSQTFKNVCLVLEPYRKLQILKDFPDMKPFLVLAKPDKINYREKHLLSLCKFLLSTPDYSVYELQYSMLQHYSDSLFAQTSSELGESKTYKVGNYLSTDSLINFIHMDYEDKPDSIAYQGKGAYSGNIVDYNVLYEGKIPNYKDSNYIYSFWIYDFTTDLYARSTIEVAVRDSADHIYRVDYANPLRIVKVLDGKWALLEHEVEIRHASDKIKITVWNPDLKKDRKIIMDEFWLKPVSTDIYLKAKEYIFKNNRYYRL